MVARRRRMAEFAAMTTTDSVGTIPNLVHVENMIAVLREMAGEVALITVVEQAIAASQAACRDPTAPPAACSAG